MVSVNHPCKAPTHAHAYTPLPRMRAPHNGSSAEPAAANNDYVPRTGGIMPLLQQILRMHLPPLPTSNYSRATTPLPTLHYPGCGPHTTGAMQSLVLPTTASAATPAASGQRFA